MKNRIDQSTEKRFQNLQPVIHGITVSEIDKYSFKYRISKTAVHTLPTPIQNASTRLCITIVLAFKTLVQSHYLSLFLHLSIRIHLIQCKQTIGHLIANLCIFFLSPQNSSDETSQCIHIHMAPCHAYSTHHHQCGCNGVFILFLRIAIDREHGWFE